VRFLESNDLKLNKLPELHCPGGERERWGGSIKDDNISHFPKLPGAHDENIHEECMMENTIGSQQPLMNIRHILPSDMKFIPADGGKRTFKEEVIPILHGMGLTEKTSHIGRIIEISTGQHLFGI
jgi:hypothetical protein